MCLCERMELAHAISSLPLGLDWVPFFFSAAALIKEKKKAAQPILLNLNAKGRRQGVKNVKSNGFFSPTSRSHQGVRLGTPWPSLAAGWGAIVTHAGTRSKSAAPPT